MNRFAEIVDRIAGGVDYHYIHLADRIDRFLNKHGVKCAEDENEWNGKKSLQMKIRGIAL